MLEAILYVISSNRLRHYRAFLSKFAVRLLLKGEQEQRRLSAELCSIQAHFSLYKTEPVPYH
jgi:hypothetical protein